MNCKAHLFFLNSLPYLLYCVLLTNCATAQPQHISFQHLSSNEGLSSNNVNAILQDDRGSMWIGTDDGLNKYDGNRIRIFHHSADDSSSLVSDEISCMVKDKKGNIWIGTVSGLSILDPATGLFRNFRYTNKIVHGLSNHTITALACDQNGNIWVGTKKGLFRYITQTNSFESIFIQGNPADESYYNINRITSIAADDNGSLWLGTINGIVQYEIVSRRFKIYAVAENSSIAAAERFIASVCLDSKKRLWVGYFDRGYSILDTRSGIFEHQLNNSLPHLQGRSELSQILRDDKGNIWIANLLKGLFYFDAGSGTGKHLINDPADEASLSDNKVKCLFQDRNGMIWVGTENAGADRFYNRPDRFTIYNRESGLLGITADDDIKAIVQDKKSTLWMGTKNGLIQYDYENKRFNIYRNVPGNNHSLVYDRINSLSLDSSGALWVGTEKGLSKMDIDSKRFNNYFSDTKNRYSLSADQVFSLYTLRNGKLLAATNGRMNVYEPSINGFRNFNNDSLFSALPKSFYTNIFQQDDDNIWMVAETNKLSITDRNYKIHTQIKNLGKIKGSNISCFAKDKMERTWMGTRNGLAMKPPGSDSFYTYTRRNGLPSDIIESIETDPEGNIWLGTHNGLAKMLVDKQNHIISIQNFYTGDGLASQVFNTDASVALKNGMLLFGTKKGAALFDPAAIDYPSPIPVAILTSFRVFDKEWILRDDGQPIRLKYNENYFSFDMSTTDYNYPEQKQYAYQLTGFDDSVNYTGTRRYAGYTNVPPGNYVLHIYASNDGHNWQSKSFSIPIIIVAAPWQRWWFRVLLVLIVLLLGLVIFNRRAQYLKKEARLNKEMAQLRLTALRSQMNPHFIFNILNSVQNKIVNSKDREEAYRYLSEVSQLIRNTLDKSDKLLIPLAEEVDSLKQYLKVESIRLGNTFDYIIYTADILDMDAILVPALLIQPFAENAIWHGLLQKKDDRKLSIQVQNAAGVVFVTIEDNGIGRKNASLQNKKQGYISMGIKAAAERLEALEELYKISTCFIITDLVDEEGGGIGTKIEFSFPDNLKE